jgi:ABC-2 type transport system ATP-binding protein
MDEAEHCDRIAIMDDGRIVALDTPQALKAAIGTDRVRLETDDAVAAAASITARFGLETSTVGGALVLQVADGERFVPRLLADLGVPVRSVSVTRPTLDDVFMTFTGRTIRDAESAPGSELPAMFRGRR